VEVNIIFWYFTFMTIEEKVKQARKRIAELEVLIKSWQNNTKTR
tara:strand:- start:199 stop:330 length:132 start_codon:yes stop_codon:yes gene_type:complete